MRSIMLIISNILKVTFRKKGNIIVYIFLPLLGVLLSLIIYGDSGASALRIGFASHDNGVLSEDIKDRLLYNEDFLVADVNENDINSKLLDFDLDAAVIVPEGFSEGIISGKPKNIEIVSLKGQDTTVWIEQLLNNYTDTLVKISAASSGDKRLFDRIYGQYKSGGITLDTITVKDKIIGKYITRTATGFLIMFIMLGTGFTTMLILKEKRNRTFYRICSAPVNSRQYILANSITSLLVVIVQIIFIQAVMKFVFKIDTGVGDIPMFVILLMFGLVAIGAGLVITAFSSSSYMAGTLSSLVMTPTCMLGGCYWDVGFMPEFMQKISYFMPQRWAMEAIEKLQAGGDEAGIYLNLLVLGAFALALILIASYKFSRTASLQKFV